MAEEARLLAQLEALLRAVDGLDIYMEGAATAAAAVAARLQPVNDATLMAVSTGTAHKSKHLTSLGHPAGVVANQKWVALNSTGGCFGAFDGALAKADEVISKAMRCSPKNAVFIESKGEKQNLPRTALLGHDSSFFYLSLMLLLLQQFVASLEQKSHSSTECRGLPLGQSLGQDVENTRNNRSSPASATPPSSANLHAHIPFPFDKRNLQQLRGDAIKCCSKLMRGRKSITPAAFSGEPAGAERGRAMKSENAECLSGARVGAPQKLNKTASTPLSLDEPTNVSQTSIVAELLQQASQLARDLPAFLRVKKSSSLEAARVTRLFLLCRVFFSSVNRATEAVSPSLMTASTSNKRCPRKEAPTSATPGNLLTEKAAWTGHWAYLFTKPEWEQAQNSMRAAALLGSIGAQGDATCRCTERTNKNLHAIHFQGQRRQQRPSFIRLRTTGGTKQQRQPLLRQTGQADAVKRTHAMHELMLLREQLAHCRAVLQRMHYLLETCDGFAWLCQLVATQQATLPMNQLRGNAFVHMDCRSRIKLIPARDARSYPAPCAKVRHKPYTRESPNDGGYLTKPTSPNSPEIKCFEAKPSPKLSPPSCGAATLFGLNCACKYLDEAAAKSPKQKRRSKRTTQEGCA
ncbi:hypothetical protein Esti_000680 [Eimeria stiedai]